ncbi:amino acid ABC transporter permease [Pseudomonas sp. GV047]|uniref:amino acid ABC transporter permease n=1 Tax=Pseudomonas sp. GV047 TaxID=2135751 RepID=UPI000D3AA9BF|nr:amino acid ABC transporter permease [Pseudomonas sp. GV047]PUB38066.1 amino acid ABC transporter membrane protein (PAAT family) [Pseudomonas sp. GV047]
MPSIDVRNAAGDQASTSTRDEPSVVPLKHPVRLAFGVLLVLVAFGVTWNVTTNPRFHWDVVIDYIFAPQILRGAVLTIILTFVSMVIGIILGTILAVMRLSDNPVVSATSRLYIWFFRGTPLLVQLIFWYNIAALYPVLSIGLPFGGPTWLLGSANDFISPLGAALLGLALNEAAYMAEIIRGGIASVDKGQHEAARALGMNGGKALRRIILPQAMRVVIPPTGNQIIGMLKGTSLVSVLAISDLLYSAQIIYSSNYQTIPLLIVASGWYLVMTSVLNVFQNKLERRYGRGFDNSTQSADRSLAGDAQ